MKLKKMVMMLLSLSFVFSAISASAYSSMSEVFVSNAIDGVTRWGSPVAYNGSASYPKVTSKWCVQGSHFVGHYGKIVSNRMGVFFNAQIFKRSKT